MSSVKSEAAAIRALLQAGAEAFSDDVLDHGYTQLAVSYNSTDQHDDRYSGA